MFAIIPESTDEPFLEAGFRKEARVPKFYCGREPAAFLGYYLDADRQRETHPEKLDAILELSRKQQPAADAPPSMPENGFTLAQCSATEADKMAEIYRKVFPTYPFPIYDPQYLRDTMESDVMYYGAVAGERLVALSASEMDTESNNVEMTDFATLPDWRGNGLGGHLLLLMEKAVKTKNINTAYTIARASSPGMNITFAKLGYRYGGRLTNNTNISGQIESMNIWYKPIG